MNDRYSGSSGSVERDLALTRVGNLLALSGQLAAEYRQLVSEYGRMIGHVPASDDGRAVTSFPGSLATLCRPQKWRDMPDIGEAKSTVADSAEAKLLRVLGIITTVEREMLGGSSPLSPQDKIKITGMVESIRYGISGQPEPGQLSLPFFKPSD